MQKSARYLLILLGVACFAVLAPVVVFYVQGKNFNFDSLTTQNTGILAVRSDPAGAQVWLNNKAADKTQANIRFLEPGDYQVKISKAPYFDWQKNLSITAHKVAWASQQADKIYLLLKDQTPEVLESSVTDFQPHGLTAYYLTAKRLAIVLGRDFKNAQSFALPKEVSQITAVSDDKFLLLRGVNTVLIFDTAARKFWDISAQINPGSRADFTSGGQLLTLSNKELSKLNWQTGQSVNLAKDVLSFFILQDKLYYLKNAGPGLELRFTTTLDPLSPTDNTLLASLPKFNSARLWVNQLKQVFILAEGGLYKLNENLDLLASGVTAWYPGAQNQNLIFTTQSELSFYDALNNTLRFISRSDAAFNNPIVSTQINYVFFAQNNQLIAVDLDDRDPPNRYVLSGATNSAKIYLDADLKTLWLQDGGILKTLPIR